MSSLGTGLKAKNWMFTPCPRDLIISTTNIPLTVGSEFYAQTQPCRAYYKAIPLGTPGNMRFWVSSMSAAVEATPEQAAAGVYVDVPAPNNIQDRRVLFRAVSGSYRLTEVALMLKSDMDEAFSLQPFSAWYREFLD